VHDADSSRPWIWKVVDHRVRRQEVRLGLRGSGVTEVTEGAAPGELIIAGPPADVAAGERVRPRVAADKP
jgi:HlyD family secretion protein